MKFTSIPFLRYSFFLVLGILFQIELPQFFSSSLIIGILITLCILILVFILFVDQSIKHRFRHCISGLAFAIVFVFGIVSVQQNDSKKSNIHLLKHNKTISGYEAKVIGEPEQKSKSVKAELALSKVKVGDKWFNSTAKIMAYFVINDVSKKIAYGDVIVIDATPTIIEEPKNPYEFNLKRFYGFKGITHRQFLSANQFKVVTNVPENQLVLLAITVRKKVDEIFTAYLPSERERNIASALILGIKNELDDEIQYAYSATGTMHVLAVSGLHVGIIYGLLVFLTNFLQKIKRGKIIQSIVLFFLIWLYALVTGLCPSVLRAVTMVSLVILADLMNKRSSVYNTLFITVFVLLCLNPFMLMEVGFQLSFLAVLGILYLYPKIYELFEFENKIIDWLWSISVMSITAQLATFPLGMLYFHQFPNYFLLSNLVVIPFAILIMYVGLGFTALSWWPFVAKWLGFAVEKMVWFLNEIILTIEHIPHSLWLGIHISVMETWLIYLSIVFLSLVFILRIFRYTIVAFCFLSCVVLIQFNKVFQWQDQKKMIIYHINKGFGVDIIQGRSALYIADSLLPLDRSKMQFHVLNNRWANGIRSASIYKGGIETDLGFVFVVNGLKFCQVKAPNKYTNMGQLEVDYVIISQNSVHNLKNMLKNVKAKFIIIDGSNKNYLAQKLVLEAEKLGIPTHSTSQNGAFLLEL